MMYTLKNKTLAVLVLFFVFMASCQNLEELNINPNVVDPSATVDPNLLISTVITSTGQTVVGLGFGDIAGVMQHTQKDGWSGGHNGYDWSNQDWAGYYGVLRNAEALLNISKKMGSDFHHGAALVLKAYTLDWLLTYGAMLRIPKHCLVNSLVRICNRFLILNRRSIQEYLLHSILPIPCCPKIRATT